MPWKVFKTGEKWCVHKLDADGSKGGVVHCHDTEEQAAAQARALYVSEAAGSKASGQLEEWMAEAAYLLVGAQMTLGAEKSQILEDVVAAITVDVVDTKGATRPAVLAFRGPTTRAVLGSLIDRVNESGDIPCIIVGNASARPTAIKALSLGDLVSPPVDQLAAVGALHQDARALTGLGVFLLPPGRAPSATETSHSEVVLASAEGAATLLAFSRDQGWHPLPPPVRLGEKSRLDYNPKALWSQVYQNDLPDSAFLYVEPGDRDDTGRTVPRSKRHFPYKDVSGSIDLPHLRNAIARIPQSTVAGINVEALQKRARKLLEDATTTKSGLQVYKQADGAYRWLGWVSNHYRDNDNPREIISSAAHKDFVAHADKTGDYPSLWLWHVPGSKIGTADWLEFADGFLLSSGTFDPDKAAVADRLAKSAEQLTMSHGFVRLKHDAADVVTDAYRMIEQSITPAGVEANPWTRFFTAKEADMPISKAKRDFLARYLPEDTLKAIEENTVELRKAAEAAGVDWKDVETADAPPTMTEMSAAEPAKPVPDTNALAEQLTEAVAAKLIERLGMKALSDTIATLQAEGAKVPDLQAKLIALEAIVKSLKRTDDEKVAEALAPKAAEAMIFSWMARAASKRADTVIKADDPADKALASNKPFLADLVERLTVQVAGGG